MPEVADPMSCQLRRLTIQGDISCHSFKCLRGGWGSPGGSLAPLTMPIDDSVPHSHLGVPPITSTGSPQCLPADRPSLSRLWASFSKRGKIPKIQLSGENSQVAAPC